MSIKKIMLWSWLFLTALVACDDDDAPQTGAFENKCNIRVKSIVGENRPWGQYELEFHYRPDGRLDRVWRFDRTENRDTAGYFSVKYDTDSHEFAIYDYVLGIDADSVRVLKKLYPETYKDSLRDRRMSQKLYSVKREKNSWEQRVFRARRNTGSGIQYNPSYLNKSGRRQWLERLPGGEGPAVIRCNEEVYGERGENDRFQRTVLKYEFVYEGTERVAGRVYKPDSNSETSWSKCDDILFGSYSGVPVSVDCATYKMRRSARKVVVAEPGRNTVYTLNDEGLAVQIETTDGETATVTYETGSGNFSELYALPLDEVLGKVWVR